MTKHDASQDNTDWLSDDVVAQLYAEYRSGLRSWFARVCQHKADLDDLVQETFLRLQRRIRNRNLGTVHKPVGLMYSIASRVLIDRLRQEMKKGAVEPWDDELEFPDPGQPLEETLFWEESLRQRQSILEELPLDQRQIIQLQISGLKPSEIADQLALPISAVRRLIRLAYLRCQNRLRWLRLANNESEQ